MRRSRPFTAVAKSEPIQILGLRLIRLILSVNKYEDQLVSLHAANDVLRGNPSPTSPLDKKRDVAVMLHRAIISSPAKVLRIKQIDGLLVFLWAPPSTEQEYNQQPAISAL